MKKIFILIVTVFFFTACEKEDTELNQPLLTAEQSADARSYASYQAQAPLSGAEEVPQRETRARGVATFHLNKAGNELRFRLNVANIENVVGAHIHIGAPEVNGPVVVPLYAAPAGGGRFNGTLAEGVITAADLTGPLAGQSLSDLLDAIQSGNTYVNVHTNDGVAPTNTGPGDFPGGEIRGQLKANW
ncbi:CHRD domain-containing protein [Pontibacter beigongshangensis]|uniref:CHRD domain-containing protein n=1 Tax=Pontibacter beigongshangensis TaxID=2574733 RepID=UPI00164F29CD|nr:CHRD domain-containing protein [Pontibacter beigongshangensis]